ncbi:MAG: NAD(P)-dependent oxidoreductase [Bacilli bacterium]|nr:NAD(P)-dependent oxidoreductase [Bacilli bacterium]
MRETVIDEAKRCLQCKFPRCRQGCPIQTPIRDAIGLLRNNQIKEAGELLFENNPLSIVCSLVCPQEKQCEGHCVLGIKGIPVPVGMIENYISDYYLNLFEAGEIKTNGKKVAIVGSGPAGITISILLARRGYEVTLFEARDKIGGIMRYGIPAFRLPKEILDRLKTVLIKMGVKIRPNTNIGANLTIDDLFRDGYKSIFLGTGVWKPYKLGVEGETLGNCCYAIEYLQNPDVYDLGKSLIVVGGGNTAMDVARTALRHGVRDVKILFHRPKEELTARKIEIDYTLMDGATIQECTMTKKVVEKGVIVTDVKLQEDGTYAEVEGSERLEEADHVIIAIGQGPRSVIVNSTKGVDTTERGLLNVDGEGRTSRPGLFAAGDVVTGAKTVVEAVRLSKQVANAMDEYMQSLGE